MRRRVKYCQYPEKCTRSLFKPRGDPLGGTRICSLPTRSSTLREILASLALRVDIAEEKRSDRHTCSLMVLKREKESRLVSGDFPSFVNSSPSPNPRRPLSLFRFISCALFARRFFATPPVPVHHLRRPDVRPSFLVSRIRRFFFFILPRASPLGPLGDQ